jgi:hypothetical protein
MDPTRMDQSSMPNYYAPAQSSAASLGTVGAPLSPKPEHAEGPIARTIEQQTGTLPSDTFLWAALGAMAVSLALQLTGQRKTNLFIGQWAPSFLLLGLYNKIVKVASSH